MSDLSEDKLPIETNCFNILGLGTRATVTNLTAELETDAERFLTSVNENACREFNYLKNSFEFSFLLDKSRSITNFI